MFVQGGIPGNHIPKHCNLITCSMTAPPASYRPTVFFRHLLVAVSFPQTKIQGGFKKKFYISVFLSISRVSSVKTQIIYCQLKCQHVSTQRVIIRPIIEPCLRYIKWPNNDSLSRNMSPLSFI